MTASLGATIGISLRRSLAAWPIVLASGLTCLLATSLLAAGPIYADAVSLAGLHRVLDDAPIGGSTIEVSTRVPAGSIDAVDAIVTDELGAALAGIGGSLVRTARTGTFDLPTPVPGPVPDLVDLAWLDGIDAHATLVAGAWPADDGPTPAVPVAVGEHVAGPLEMRVGDVLSLRSRLEPDSSVAVRIAGIFRIDDHADPFWWDEAQVLDGMIRSQDFATHGPLFTTRARLLEHAVPRRVALGWRVVPTSAAVTLDGMDALRARMQQLDPRLEAALDGTPVTVTSDLPGILDEAGRSLLVSRAGVLVLTVQLAILAGYAVLLSAALLVEHRRLDTAMLRSRGAGPVRIVAVTLVEALVLVLPAVLLGPWLAAIGLRAFDVVGPLAAIGLAIEPVVSVAAYLAAGIGGLGCLLALVLPALPARRSFATVQGGVTRGSTTPVGQRLGLDLVLLVVAGIGLWQLRHYGAPLTRDLAGTIGIDPLLVATPAIGLLAGAAIALRLLPTVALAIERVTARGRGLVAALGARQLARRPLRYTRAALLLMLAMAMGVFATSYTWAWTTSQHDQAEFQVGADVGAVPSTRSGALPRWGLDTAYGAIPGVAARTPVDRLSVRVVGTEPGELLAVDAGTAGAVLRLRGDLADASVADLLAPLAEARPDPAVIRLPVGTRTLRLGVDVDLPSLERPDVDAETGAPETTPVDPAVAATWEGVVSRVVVRDAAGQLFRFTGASTTMASGPSSLDVPLGDPATVAAFTEPLDLLALELSVGLPSGLQSPDAGIAIRSVEAAGPDGAWAPVPVGSSDPIGGWRLTAAVYGAPHAVVGPAAGVDALEARMGVPGLPLLPGIDRYGRGLELGFAPASLATATATPIPVLANDRFLAATGTQVGDSIPLDLGGARRTVLIVAAVRAVPTIDPATPALLLDLPTVALARFEGTDSVDPPDAWWFSIEPGQAATVVEALGEAPFLSGRVVSTAGREQALASDPVALGIIGALAIGFVAAAAFAVVGFAVSAAVSARERVSEFALLRAVGLSNRQLTGWLSLENAVLAGVSLVSGTTVGLLMAWAVLPSVSVTREGGTPVPPVRLDVPWDAIAALEVAAVLALAVTVLVLARLLRRVGLASALRIGED